MRQQKKADFDRQTLLEQLGLRVLRVRAGDVGADRLSNVVSLIEHAAGQEPPPVPLSPGERGQG